MKIYIKGKDGSVAIMSLASPETNIDEALKKFHEAHPGDYGDHLAESDLKGTEPESREFRDAWRIKNNSLYVCPIKAAEIHLSRVRKARDLELERLDKEQLKFLADPWKPKEIEAKKQILRDLPANWLKSGFDIAKWPDELPRP